MEAQGICSGWLSAESCIVVIIHCKTPGSAEEFNPASRNPEEDLGRNDRDRMARRVVGGNSLIRMHIRSLGEKLYVPEVKVSQRTGCM